MRPDHAETGQLSLLGTRLILEMAAGGRCMVDAWPGADRHVGRRVHIIGVLAQDNVLVAQSIAPLDPA